MKIEFYPISQKRDKKLKYVIIGARHRMSQWIFVQHKQRKTWELPAGHIEANENPLDAAIRELYEETGTVNEHVIPLFDYSVEINKTKIFGRVFYTEIDELAVLPNFEIGKVSIREKLPQQLTYPEIQSALFTHLLEKITPVKK